MKNLVHFALLTVLAVSFLACQKLPLPSADIKEPKDKIKYTQPVRKIEPDSTTK